MYTCFLLLISSSAINDNDGNINSKIINIGIKFILLLILNYELDLIHFYIIKYVYFNYKFIIIWSVFILTLNFLFIPIVFKSLFFLNTKTSFLNNLQIYSWFAIKSPLNKRKYSTYFFLIIFI